MQVQVGLMDARGRTIRGSRVYVLVERTSCHNDILTEAVHQMQLINCEFVNKNFMLCLPDGRSAEYLPGGQKPFVLVEYKEMVLSDYCKLVFYLRETDTGFCHSMVENLNITTFYYHNHVH